MVFVARTLGLFDIFKKKKKYDDLYKEPYYAGSLLIGVYKFITNGNTFWCPIRGSHSPFFFLFHTVSIALIIIRDNITPLTSKMRILYTYCAKPKNFFFFLTYDTWKTDVSTFVSLRNETLWNFANSMTKNDNFLMCIGVLRAVYTVCIINISLFSFFACAVACQCWVWATCWWWWNITIYYRRTCTQVYYTHKRWDLGKN